MPYLHTSLEKYSAVGFYVLAMMSVAWWIQVDYVSGLYELALFNGLLLPFLLFCLLHHIIEGKPVRYFWGAKGLMVTAFFVVVLQGFFDSGDDVYLLAVIVALCAYGCLSLSLVPAYQGCLLVGFYLAELSAGRGASSLEPSVYLGLFLFLTWLSLFRYLSAAKRLKRLSVKDIESDTYNRKHFYTVLEKELNRSQLQKPTISLIGVHLEDLDQIADIYGQTTVKQFLPAFVRYLRQQIRTGDDIFRIKNDVFVLMLENCSEDGAAIFMERIKRSFTDFSASPFSEVSLSVAHVLYRPPEPTGSIESRLLKQLKKQKKAILDLSVFSEPT